jgi:hypothetical protein
MVALKHHQHSKWIQQQAAAARCHWAVLLVSAALLLAGLAGLRGSFSGPSHSSSAPDSAAAAGSKGGGTSSSSTDVQKLLDQAATDPLFQLLEDMRTRYVATTAAAGYSSSAAGGGSSSSSGWGSVLDSGTGELSLAFLVTRNTSSWTAVTADKQRQRRLAEKFAGQIRAGTDALVTGNWMDDEFLKGQQFDWLLEDYLLGAVEGFAPFFQHKLYQRLRPHVRKGLLLIGLEPHPETVPADAEISSAAQHSWEVLLETVRLRDAALLLAKDRPYREFPLDWVEAHLTLAGFRVVEKEVLPYSTGENGAKSQLGIVDKHLHLVGSKPLAKALGVHADKLRLRAQGMPSVPFARHHVLLAVPKEA